MKGAVLLLLIAGVAFPLVVGFHVEPVSAAHSGWTRPHDPNGNQGQSPHFGKLRASPIVKCNT